MKILSIKRIFLILFVLTSISLSLFSGEDYNILTLPVIPQLSKMNSVPLCKESMYLKVNGIPRNISRISKVERSLDCYQDMGRDIVLSFMTSVAGDNLYEGISYFISDVLREPDSLIIVTPLKAYRMKPDNKTKIINEIGEILRRDCKSFNNRKSIFEKRIRSELKKIRLIISAGRSLYNNTRHTKVLFRFLHSFPEEFNQYLKFTLLQYFENFEGVTDQILGGENEKWWIHFDNHDTGEMIIGVREILKLIESAGPVRSGNDSANHGMNPALKSDLNERSIRGPADGIYRNKFLRFIKEIRQSLNFGKRKLMKDIGSKIKSSGICFNKITFNTKEIYSYNLNTGSNSPSVMILGDICMNSGGKTLFENNIEKALKEIACHKFTLYHLDFPLYRKDNGITIDIDDKYSMMKGFFYPKVLSEDYISKMRLKLMKEKCRIGDLIINNSRVLFTLHGFGRNGDKIGLLKVRIRIFDSNGKHLYKNAKTLRSAPDKKKISLSIPIPSRIKGECSVMVSVTDLIARNTSSSRKNIRLR